MEISHTIPKQPDESAQSHHKIPTTSMLEISHYVNCLAVDDKTKLLLMENNKPPTRFQFPAKQYKDKQKKGGVMNRYCQEEWFRDFDFISYSIEQDGLYCNTCVLFNTENRKPNQDQPNILVTKPYRNLKDAKSDLKTHSVTHAHVTATAKREAFMQTSSLVG